MDAGYKLFEPVHAIWSLCTAESSHDPDKSMQQSRQNMHCSHTQSKDP